MKDLILDLGFKGLQGLLGFFFFVGICVTMSRIADIRQLFKHQINLQKKFLDRLSEIESHLKRVSSGVSYLSEVTANSERVKHSQIMEGYNAVDQEQKQIEDEYFLNRQQATPPAHESSDSGQPL